MLPVALINPPVRTFPIDKLPALLVILPLTDNELNVPTDVILACVAVANDPVKLVAVTLPPVMLPVADINPVIYSPVVANTATLPVPPTPTVTLPPELTTFTLLVPLTIALGVPPPVIPVSNDPLPVKKLPAILPTAVTLPTPTMSLLVSNKLSSAANSCIWPEPELIINGILFAIIFFLYMYLCGKHGYVSTASGAHKKTVVAGQVHSDRCGSCAYYQCTGEHSVANENIARGFKIATCYVTTCTD